MKGKLVGCRKAFELGKKAGKLVLNSQLIGSYWGPLFVTAIPKTDAFATTKPACAVHDSSPAQADGRRSSTQK